MDNKEFGRRLESRTLQFAVQIIKLSGKLPKEPEGRVIRNQITKSGSSIGANYREANRARSRADFMNRIKICESEASETCYWLDIIAKMKWAKDHDIPELKEEATQLLKLFSSIGKKQ